jgi:dinuclear metal center YbgI/SA1388 family protein
MATVADILKYIESIAPPYMQEDWDNVGLLCGSKATPVTKVLVALDPFEGVCREAAQWGAQLIVTHHPVIFRPISRLSADSMPYRLAAAGISVISAHTNLDKAVDGVNDTLAARLGLTDIEIAADGMTRVGTLPEEMTATAFAAHVAEVLGTPVRAAGDKPVKRVALCGGAAGSSLFAHIGSADCFITGEVKHHEWLAYDGAINVIDAGHYATEVPVVDTLAGWLSEAYPDLAVTVYRDGDPYSVVK